MKGALLLAGTLCDTGTSPVCVSQSILRLLDLYDSMGHSQKFGMLRDSSASPNPNVPLHRIDSLVLGGGVVASGDFEANSKERGWGRVLK